MNPSITFPVLTVFNLSWTLTDAQGNPINNAIVTANLYAGRSIQNPLLTPGTVVSPISALNLPYVVGSAGQYSAPVAATLNPPLKGVGFVLVVDATVGGMEIYHQEIPAVIQSAGSPLDLTTVTIVKDWLTGFGANSADDAKIQACITAWGYEFINRTGRGDQNGDFQQSPYVTVCNFTETHDGSDTARLYLRNRPIVNVSSLMINGISIGQSGAVGMSGYVIDGTGRSIALRQGIAGIGSSPSSGYGSYVSGPFRSVGSGLKFWKGIQNVTVQYSAGYGSTPFDIVECANKVVAQNYRRRNWVDEESRAVASGGGSVRYRSWTIPPECQDVVDRYTRTL